MWRILGDDRYTCVAPPGFEKDPAVTAAIREFDPGMIPFWRLQRWAIDGVERLVVHHGIARYYPFPRHLRRHVHFDMPAIHTHDVPNFLDAIFEDQTAESYYRGGPGAYVPWDWRIYYWCRRQFDRLTVEAYDRLIEQRRAREAAIRKAWAEWIEYRKRQLEPYLLRQAERISEAEWEQLQQRQHRNAIRRRLGLAPERLRTRPSVHIRVPAPLPWSPRGTETYGRVAPAQERES